MSLINVLVILQTTTLGPFLAHPVEQQFGLDTFKSIVLALDSSRQNTHMQLVYTNKDKRKNVFICHFWWLLSWLGKASPTITKRKQLISEITRELQTFSHIGEFMAFFYMFVFSVCLFFYFETRPPYPAVMMLKCSFDSSGIEWTVQDLGRFLHFSKVVICLKNCIEHTLLLCVVLRPEENNRDWTRQLCKREHIWLSSSWCVRIMCRCVTGFLKKKKKSQIFLGSENYKLSK